MMQQTRVWRLLQGYRDRSAANLGVIADGLVRLSYLAAQHLEIREVDINPSLADDKGAIALGARVRVVGAVSEPRVAMAIRPYPSQWQADAELEGLGAMRIRPSRPEDEALYQDFFANVTLEDQRLRFFGAGVKLSHALLARLTQIGYAREMAFVAIARETGRC
jgi:acetyltransferase